MSIRFGSLCSGIEAASVAWRPIGWRAAWFAEIEPFPCALLAHHFPAVRNLGDVTKFKEWPDAAIDLLAGGTPCQSFSIAGLRKGLADPRGNLMLTYLAVAARYRPRWLVWENVPGVLSADGGRAFGTLLGGLAELGYGFAYRVLDAQYVRVESHARAVPQRRRRVFVVGYFGDWRRAAAVLFERESLRWHFAPRREAGQRIAGTFGARTRGGSGLGTDFECDGGLVAGALCERANPSQPDDSETYVVAHSLRAEGFDASEDGTGRGTPLVPVFPYTLAVRGRGSGRDLECRQDGTANAIVTPNGGRDGIGVGAIAYALQAGATRENPACGPDGVGVQAGVAYTLEARAEVQAVAFTQNQRDELRLMDVAGALAAETGAKQQTYAMYGAAVRRLTPLECERLQGFPDFYTDVLFRGKRVADGPRYKALGNSMAVSVMNWIGQRIDMVERLGLVGIAPAQDEKT